MNNCVMNCENLNIPDNIDNLQMEEIRDVLIRFLKTAEARVLFYDGKMAELCNYLKTNLVNTIAELTIDMKHSGELESIINEIVLSSVKQLQYDTADLQNQTVQFSTPEMFGAAADGITDDTDVIQESVNQGKPVELRGNTYVISDTIELNSVMQNGTIIYEGVAHEPIFNMKDKGGLKDVNIIIKTPNFESDVILVDYTKYDSQFNPLKFVLENVYIDNTVTTEFIDGSSCIKIKYDKYKVIYAQNITGLRFDGRMDYGIYIEPVLRDKNDNPVFNTSKFENVFFNSVNCAIKVLPVMRRNTLKEARGGVGLLLVNFANQYTDGVYKPFLDLHNTNIEGSMVIPWDYYGEHIPQDGIYKCENSNIVLNKDYFPAAHDSSVKYMYTQSSTNEIYSNINTIKVEEVGDRAPVRSTGIAWGVDNIKMVVFTPEEDNPYKLSYLGFEIQPSNKRYSNNPTIQLGFTSGGIPYIRKYDGVNKKWLPLRQVYVEGGCPQSYAGKRPDGVAVGDMKFDTTKNKPVWWNGTNWILADGTTI